MSGPFKMKGAGEVYYDGNGDPVNLNSKNMIKLTGDEEYDEHGNKQFMHKETKDIFYKDNPRGEDKKWQGGPNMPSDRPIIPENYFG